MSKTMPAKALQPMPTLADFRNRHADDTIIVCGCGESLNELKDPARFITIGVNDIGRLFHPNYLVVLNPPSQFTGDRFRYVEATRAEYVFTQLHDLRIAHSRIVRFRLGRYGGTDFSDPNVLHHTQNSPYLAVCLAVHMGAKRIGLIGVDFSDNHFFSKTGRHPLASRVPQIDEEYARLAHACKNAGIELVNLSAMSKLTALPKTSLGSFSAQNVRRDAQEQSLRIVSYSTTPVAGVPAILARCIDARTPHSARCIWASASYGNGVEFKGDVEWARAPLEAESLLRPADVVIVHNGKVHPPHRKLLEGKAIITMAHNYMWNVETTYVDQGFPGVVVGQYQAALPEFRDWTVVPNPVPLWEPAYQPGAKGDTVTVCFTPSGKHERYPPGHRLYWHAKGYDTTMAVLERLRRKYSIAVEAIRDGQVSHAESLAMKRRSHIVIDECVTGSYHRNSLEGLATGCVVVNGLGLLSGVEAVLHLCAGNPDSLPFMCSRLEDLEGVLESLIERGRQVLVGDGQRNRHWLEWHWDFGRQWEQIWVPVMEQALERSHRGNSIKRLPGACMPAPDQASALANSIDRQTRKGISVIVPHGGRARLPNLGAMLASLRQCRGVSEIIVAEMGTEAVAVGVASRWNAKYVFIHHSGVFEKARAINVGCALSEFDLLLWCDNDLLFAPAFPETAAEELRTRNLDFLIPYSAIAYLSEADSAQVIVGTRNPNDCKPTNLLRPGTGVAGGIGIVKRGFLTRYGGISEEFRGWGGEDNAWWHKVSLLGRAGITTRPGQYAYHLFHPDSGGYGGGAYRFNPHYPQNVAVLSEMRRLRSAEEYLRRFPPSCRSSPPWDPEKRVVLVTPPRSVSACSTAEQAARALEALFGVQVTLREADWQPNFETELLEIAPGAIVAFGTGVAQSILTDSALRSLWRTTVAVLDGFGPPELDRKWLAHAGAVVVRTEAEFQALRREDLPVWYWAMDDHDGEGSLVTGITLTQPLSLIFARVPGSEDDKACDCTITHTGSVTLPVWLYWEGECPDWIQACQQTIFEHAPDVRLLDWTAFEKLWDQDRDIDLSQLQVAHRADFVRAFLLARYGGLWIDSDCIVVKPLQPILDLLAHYDFIAHPDRQGYYPNGFIGARVGSIIAQRFYQTVCQALRSGQRLGWISLGGQPLTEALCASETPWYELECEAIQPICWSRPEVFFALASPEEHTRNFNDRVICYMLSNTEVQKFLTQHPSQSLMQEGTFFRFLLRHADASHTEAYGSEALAPNFVDHLTFLSAMLADIAPHQVLDVGVGLGRWGVIVRECCESPQTRRIRTLWQVRLEGIDFNTPGRQALVASVYDQIRCLSPEQIADSLESRYNLIILGEEVTQLSARFQRKILSRALETSDYVLFICSPSTSTIVEQDMLTLNNYPSSRLVRQITHRAPGGTKSGIFLLSLCDPRQLGRRELTEATFGRVFHSNTKLLMESASGPGSSLEQTTEIRQRLPLLLQDLGTRSILDAACGDFNWLQHVALGVDRYLGIDIVPELIARNQSLFGNSIRQFECLDFTSDALPQVDVILCRDALVHFSFEDIFRAISNLRRSGSTYLLATTFPKHDVNRDIAIGQWRTLNLERPPFDFSPPLRIINEKCTENGGIYSDKSLALWKLMDLVY